MEQEIRDEGVKVLDIYWTLGRYDSVVVVEAPSECAAMRMANRRMDDMDLETMVAIPALEARRLVG